MLQLLEVQEILGDIINILEWVEEYGKETVTKGGSGELGRGNFQYFLDSTAAGKALLTKLLAQLHAQFPTVVAGR